MLAQRDVRVIGSGQCPRRAPLASESAEGMCRGYGPLHAGHARNTGHAGHTGHPGHTEHHALFCFLFVSFFLGPRFSPVFTVYGLGRISGRIRLIRVNVI